MTRHTACFTVLWILALLLPFSFAGDDHTGASRKQTKSDAARDASAAAAQEKKKSDAAASKTGSKSDEASDVSEERPRRVIKSESEWAKILTHSQFLVCRTKATEPAFSGKYVNNHAAGIYACVCCGEELFSSQTKFNSGTGWPSFWRAIKADRIETAPDFSEPEARVEVKCSVCGAHLGHVFQDGPPPTGLRFCLNSVALKFVPDKSEPTAASKPSTHRTHSATSSKPKQAQTPKSAESHDS